MRLYPWNANDVPRNNMIGRLCMGAVMSVTILLIAMSGAAMAGNCGFKGGDADAGKVIYHQTCVACHGEDGRGQVPGAPDFAKTGGGVLSKPHSTLTDHIVNGFRGPNAPLAMPPKGGIPDLSDQDAKNVHSYLHEAFGCG